MKQIVNVQTPLLTADEKSTLHSYELHCFQSFQNQIQNQLRWQNNLQAQLQNFLTTATKSLEAALKKPSYTHEPDSKIESPSYPPGTPAAHKAYTFYRLLSRLNIRDDTGRLVIPRSTRVIRMKAKENIQMIPMWKRLMYVKHRGENQMILMWRAIKQRSFPGITLKSRIKFDHLSSYYLRNHNRNLPYWNVAQCIPFVRLRSEINIIFKLNTCVFFFSLSAPIFLNFKCMSHCSFSYQALKFDSLIPLMTS